MTVSAQVYTRLIFVWGKSMALARIDLRAFKRVRERVDQSAYRHHQSDSRPPVGVRHRRAAGIITTVTSEHATPFNLLTKAQPSPS